MIWLKQDTSDENGWFFLASTSSFLCEALPQWGILWVTMETGPDPVQLPQSSPQRPVDKKPKNCSENPR